MVKCKRIQKKLIDYVDGILGAEERDIVEKHIRTCKSCRQEVNLLKKLPQINYKIEYPPDSVWDSFLDDLHRRIDHELYCEFIKQQNQKKWAFASLSAVALIIVIIFVSALTEYYTLSKPIRINENKELQQKSDLLVSENSENLFILGLISRTFIDDKDVKKLKYLNKYINSSDYYKVNYDYFKTYSNPDLEVDKEYTDKKYKHKEPIQTLFNENISKLKNIYIMENEFDDTGAI